VDRCHPFSFCKELRIPTRGSEESVLIQCRKCGTRINFEGYQHHLRQQLASTSMQDQTTTDVVDVSDKHDPSPMDGAPHPATFAEICEMIASGKEIPGIKQIPDVVLEGQGTQASATKRKKPWEKDANSHQVASWQE